MSLEHMFLPARRVLLNVSPWYLQNKWTSQAIRRPSGLSVSTPSRCLSYSRFSWVNHSRKPPCEVKLSPEYQKQSAYRLSRYLMRGAYTQIAVIIYIWENKIWRIQSLETIWTLGIGSETRDRSLGESPKAWSLKFGTWTLREAIACSNSSSWEVNDSRVGHQGSLNASCHPKGKWEAKNLDQVRILTNDDK